MPAVYSKSMGKKPMLDENLLMAAMTELGISNVHAHTLWRHLIQVGTTEIASIPTLPKRMILMLESEFTITTSTVISRTDNSDGSTTKLLIELQNGQRIESVIMRYGDVALSSFPVEEKEKMFHNGEYKFKSSKRATLCVSSQVGCAMGCTFCATGTMGLVSNLSSGEILEQLYHANKVEKIRNVVFMGMGEPLDNYDAVLSACKGMQDTGRFGLSPSRISVSTVGVVPRMISLAKDLPEIGLALSLHAPTQDLRTQIVPTAKAWKIEKIMAAAEAFIRQQNSGITSINRKKHVLVEYVMIQDVNDSVETAHALGKLLQGKDMLLNLIPYNPTLVPFDYKSPTRETQNAFVDIVRNTYNVHTLLRQELGQDISSACGQLVITSQKQCTESITDLEDLAGKSARLTSKSSSSKKFSKSTKINTKKSMSRIRLQTILMFSIVGLLLILAAKNFFGMGYAKSESY